MKKLFYLLGIALMLTSCYSHKKSTHISDKKFSEDIPTHYNSTDFQYFLQPNDVLSVTVKSLDAVNAELFNIQTQPNYGNINGNALFLSGYSINSEGNIKLPIVGDVKVSGLTIEQAQELVQEKVDQYLVNATVLVKMVSFKIAVLGEVKNPGYYYVFNAEANVFEGLALAGDILPTGNHEKVKLVRKTATGADVFLLDLTNPNVMESQNFYLLPNDIVFVEPLKARTSRTNLELFSFISSGITTLILILNYFNNN